MNINPSIYLRAISSLFFIFTLLFGASMAQASVFQKVTRSLNLSYVPQSKIDEVIDILQDSGLNTDYMLPEDLKKLALALDDPVSLIKPSLGDLFEFEDSIIFFARFNLYKDSDVLFTKLFGSTLEEIPFKDAENNWESLLGDLKFIESSGGRARFTKTELEAAAISFVHRNQDLLPEDSLGIFFRNRFTIDHYINPHFTLSPHNIHYRLIMDRILISLKKREFSFYDQELVARIWNNMIEEIKIYNQGRRDIPEVLVMKELLSADVFVSRTINALIKRNRSELSFQSDPFLRAMMELAREDNRLAKIVDFLASESGTDYTIVRMNVERAIRMIFFN